MKDRQWKKVSQNSQQLPQVVLGVTELRVSGVGLGCSQLGSILAGNTTEAAERLVHHAVHVGVTLFDTADIYGQGESERILGRALKKQRNSVTLVTKGGQFFTAAQRIGSLARRPVRILSEKFPTFHAMLAAKRANRLPRDYTAAYLKRALEGSLKRLRTDHIDLYLLHSPDGTEIQKSDSYAMLECMKEKGLVRHWGISCDDLPAVEAALHIDGISALEIPLSILYPAAGVRPQTMADLMARRIGLIVGQILRLRHDTVPLAITPKQRVQLVLSNPNCAAVVGTRSIRHLNELVVG